MCKNIVQHHLGHPPPGLQGRYLSPDKRPTAAASSQEHPLLESLSMDLPAILLLFVTTQVAGPCPFFFFLNFFSRVRRLLVEPARSKSNSGNAHSSSSSLSPGRGPWTNHARVFTLESQHRLSLAHLWSFVLVINTELPLNPSPYLCSILSILLQPHNQSSGQKKRKRQ